MLTLKKKLSNNADLEVNTLDQNLQLPRATRMLLGSLNSGCVAPRSVRDTRGLIQTASRRPLKAAYPILCYVVENAIQRRGRAGEANVFLRKMFEATLLSCELTYAIAVRPSRKPRPQPDFEKLATAEKTIIYGGHRAEAIDYLRAWLRENASDFLKVCDPYFGPKDLEIVKLVLETVPTMSISILTSRKAQDRVEQSWSGSYRKYWDDELSDQSPPQTDIYVVGTTSGEPPIHDCWWLTHGKGLRFGSSFNSLGISKDSEISVLDAKEVSEREAETDQYIFRVKREHLGEKLFFESFTL